MKGYTETGSQQKPSGQYSASTSSVIVIDDTADSVSSATSSEEEGISYVTSSVLENGDSRAGPASKQLQKSITPNQFIDSLEILGTELESKESTTPKKTVNYAEGVAKSYIALAEEKGWRNGDNSMFPVSVANLCNYLRVKMATNTPRSLDWYCGALNKYQKDVLNIQNWNEIRYHSDVKELMNQIREGKLNIEESSPLAPIDKGKGKRAAKIVDDAKIFVQASKDEDRAESLINQRMIQTVRSFDKPRLSPLFDVPMIIEDGKFNTLLSKYKCVDSSSSLENSLLVSTEDRLDSSSDDSDDRTPKRRSQLFTPPKKRRLHDKQAMCQSDLSNDESRSFKSRFQRSFGTLKKLYSGKCQFHPNGCVLLSNDRHFVLNDCLYRHWASLCASGSDFVETSLPVSDTLDEFSEKYAILI